jgi:hypothetical protein
MEKRSQIRYTTQSHARIAAVFDGEILLKDISVTGCGVESTTFIDLKPDCRYKMEIVPEKAANIGPFEIVVELQWTRKSGYSFEAGFSITESPKGKHFQRYVDYLSWR